MISVTESAARRVIALAEGRGGETMLRLGVDGGGCSGFQYKIDLVSEAGEGDHRFESHGIVVVVDEVSLPFLDGAVVDYVESFLGASFKINNPNATASCGCGTSFTV